MNIIERIKNFWKNRNIKALPEAQVQNTRQDNINNRKNRNWILSNTNSNHRQPTKLETEIETFLQSYYQRLEGFDDSQNINNYMIAYTALTTMGGKPVTQEEYNKNYYSEQELLNQLNNTNEYTVEMQKQANNNYVDFYHIKSQNYQMPNFDDMLRVYINCNNGNVSELSQAILANNRNPNFYMKFTSNQQNTNFPRNEKIVIYCHKDEFDYTMQLLEYTKNMRPDLFVESENTLPFLQSVNGMSSVSKQPKTNQFVDLKGQTKTVTQSTNAFLINILQESYMEAAREIARVDQNISFLVDDQYINNETLYMKNYPYINEYYHDYLLNSMQAKMQVLSQRNDLYIEGLFENKDLNYKQNSNEFER